MAAPAESLDLSYHYPEILLTPEPFETTTPAQVDVDKFLAHDNADDDTVSEASDTPHVSPLPDASGVPATGLKVSDIYHLYSDNPVDIYLASVLYITRIGTLGARFHRDSTGFEDGRIDVYNIERLVNAVGILVNHIENGGNEESRMTPARTFDRFNDFFATGLPTSLRAAKLANVKSRCLLCRLRQEHAGVLARALVTRIEEVVLLNGPESRTLAQDPPIQRPGFRNRGGSRKRLAAPANAAEVDLGVFAQTPERPATRSLLPIGDILRIYTHIAQNIRCRLYAEMQYDSESGSSVPCIHIEYRRSEGARLAQCLFVTLITMYPVSVYVGTFRVVEAPDPH